ncbi:alkaline phosphatase, partial [Escherichia coli]|nr:alkaline phosphatase [Escherichia coli]
MDMAHHDGNAFRALTETIEFSNAVKTALSKGNLDGTLIIVTADHSHTFTIGGYPARGNNILGLIREAGPGLVPDRDPKLDLQKKP